MNESYARGVGRTPIDHDRFPPRFLLPYLVGLVGVAAITAAIGAVKPWLDLPNLTAAYLLLVLWLGARFGWPAAVWSALLAFFVYEWFFVPPFGTIYISAAHDLWNLVVLLLAALAGGRLTATIAAQKAGAAARALESSTLYELAVAALREPQGQSALSLLGERAKQAGGLSAISLVEAGQGPVRVVAGDQLTPGELDQARWAFENGTNLGARLHDGQLEAVRTSPAQQGPAFVVLTAGVAAVRLPESGMDPERRRLLAALLGLAGLLLDRRLAAAATERARELEASDRLKAAVLSSVTHELKSPIASLRAGLTTLLMPRAGLDADLREMVAGLDGQAARLDRMVGDLLAMSRLEAGLPLERAEHDLDELVGTVLHTLRIRVREFDVRVELPPDLPPVFVDELYIERVMTNLLENAAEWTVQGGTITIGARRLDAMVEVWVEDQGSEIPAADLEVIFEKFWTSRKGGSGLGLAICRQVIDAHGGTIRAENTRSGPRFVFTLPLAGQPAPVPSA